MSHYLPLGTADIPALTPAEAGIRFSDPGRMQGIVDLGTAVSVQPVPRLRIAAAVMINTTVRNEIRTLVLSHFSRMRCVLDMSHVPFRDLRHSVSCLPVEHVGKPCKKAELIKMPFGTLEAVSCWQGTM